MLPILVVDDDPRMLTAVKRALTFEGFAVLSASSGLDALRILQLERVQLVVMDVMMPDLDGMEALRRLRQSGNHTPVVLLTARDRPTDQVQGLEDGADDYITKPFSIEVLVARIRLILRRNASETRHLTYRDLLLDLPGHQAYRDGRPLPLTPLEFRVLRLLTENPQRVFSKAMLLERVWGEDHPGDGTVVEGVMSALRAKMEARGESRLIQTIRGVGYVLRET